jgi:hypothetical protein
VPTLVLSGGSSRTGGARACRDGVVAPPRGRLVAGERAGRRRAAAARVLCACLGRGSDLDDSGCLVGWAVSRKCSDTSSGPRIELFGFFRTYRHIWRIEKTKYESCVCCMLYPCVCGSNYTVNKYESFFAKKITCILNYEPPVQKELRMRRYVFTTQTKNMN